MLYQASILITVVLLSGICVRLWRYPIKEG